MSWAVQSTIRRSTMSRTTSFQPLYLKVLRLVLFADPGMLEQPVLSGEHFNLLATILLLFFEMR